MKKNFGVERNRQSGKRSDGTKHDKSSRGLSTLRGTDNDNSFSGYHSMDDGMDLLVHRMSKLDNRIADIEQRDLAARSSSNKIEEKKRNVSKNHNDQDDSCDSLNALEIFNELEKRVIRNEKAMARIMSKDNDGRSGLDDTRETLQEQITSLKRKLKILGNSTSRACRSLSVGVTDAQNASLELYSWADKVHNAFEQVSKSCLNMEKNIIPRAQLFDIEKRSKPGKRGRAKSYNHKGKRSASAGCEFARGHSTDDVVDSDYEIDMEMPE